MLRVMDIVEGTSVDGPGLRTTVYLAGCNHRCPGCHNPETWPMTAGREMSVSEIMKVLEEAEFPVTLSGGDPLYQTSGAAALCREIKARMGVDIWLYTGFTLEEIRNSKQLQEPLPWVDTIVDGPFKEELRDISLLFRGSLNQRILKVRDCFSELFPA